MRGHQPTTAAEINAHVSAEHPDTSGCSTGLAAARCPCDAHRLDAMVTKHMQHQCKEGRCFKKDTPEHLRGCKYGYPFDVDPVTHVDDTGRVRYMRRDEADASTVAHNPALLLKFDAHINVEIVHTTM